MLTVRHTWIHMYCFRCFRKWLTLHLRWEDLIKNITMRVLERNHVFRVSASTSELLETLEKCFLATGRRKWMNTDRRKWMEDVVIICFSREGGCKFRWNNKKIWFLWFIDHLIQFYSTSKYNLKKDIKFYIVACLYTNSIISVFRIFIVNTCLQDYVMNLMRALQTHNRLLKTCLSLL